MIKSLLFVLFLSMVLNQTLAVKGKKKLLKAIGINKKKCHLSKVKSFSALLKAGCWRMSDEGSCVFTSPCVGKQKAKFNCKNSPKGFCKACNLCTCDGLKETCAVNIISCEKQLEYSLDQGCFVKKGKKCYFQFPCPKPQECKPNEQKCINCNKCVCTGGKWSCTKKVCAPCFGDCWGMNPGGQCVCKSACKGSNPVHTPCKPTAVACDKCNRCTCDNNNLWGCTKKGCLQPCPPGCWGFDQNNNCECKTHCDGSSSLPLGSCKPGKKACQACNTCFCSEGQWACTEKACLQKCPSNCWVLNKSGNCECKEVCDA